MKLATLRTGKGTTTAALAVGAESYAPLPYSNVGELLADPGWRSVVYTQASAAERCQAHQRFDAGRLENRIHINQAGDATPQTLVNATATEE